MRVARHSKSGQYAAVKIVSKTQIIQSRRSFENMEDDADRILRGLEREIVVMKLIDHPNIMHLYDVWETSGELYLILEYVEGGELFDYICEKGRLPPDEALDYFQQLMDALDYCHKLNVAHRDLKPENLLLDKDKVLKVADFGMAAWQIGNNLLETACGSPHYAAPEIIAGKPYDGKTSDVWSSGIILFALLAGKLPFDDDNIGKLLEKVRIGGFVMPDNIDPGAQDLIRRMLEKDITKRITVSQILEHPWFLSRPRRLPQYTAPTLNEITQPLSSTSEIDMDILGNLRTLWHGTSDSEIINALLSKEHKWEKIVYSLLLRYRTKLYENHNEELERARSQRRSERKKKRARREQSKQDENSIPSRPDPPTPRRASKRENAKAAASDAACLDLVRSPLSDMITSPLSPSLLTPSTGQASSPFALTSPKSPLWEALDVAPPLDVPELHDERVQKYFHQIYEHLNSMQKQPEDPNRLSNCVPNRTEPTIRQVVKPVPIDIPPNIHTIPHQEAGRGLGISSVLPEANEEDNGILKKSSLRKAPRTEGGMSKRIQIVLPPPIQRGGGQRRVSYESCSSATPTHSSSEGTSLSTSSAPRRSWFANLFKFKQVTYTLTSMDSLPATQETCKQLLTNFGVQFKIMNTVGTQSVTLQCQLDDVRDPAGLMEVTKAVRFRIDMRNSSPGPNETNQQQCLLELVYEKGSLSTFRLICQRLRRDWVLDSIANNFTSPPPILRNAY